ncbi:uncharacterized protein [Physcomitrium patens]|uniref:Uncharacterized protein n=1 Tax=Physcomitrium patens TaxID=3218 RepID=A0A2K1IGX4_PHYPA|nr:uncharacterized protein LOC112277061 [Physcomitrium patens]XP_024364813.1 uncharacterized protein LOC112277061 [Physcomitrium patens]XP_024364814.1 uncharacterized protein LOC112277061 [Physcomitrium patens]XP_024364815.1 uncharacterized protein LOC112277061 [Physcomitrium patens]PNR28529.1 hypothetical protein PHYPA_029121 [Physcomitrium patens]|eukprot:XP_024364812.1 uncharacterized protein LOC112277061 [Physcomitrella patens]
MELSVQSDAPVPNASEGSSSSMGWPFGLPTCMVIQTPSRKEFPETPPAFHQQFMNLQTTFLLPFFSDVDVSSSSDTDSRSEAASSFFKDSRRITLGSLIGLPMDSSFRSMHPDAHYHVFSDRRRNFLPSCGILEFLGCVRNSSSLHEFEASEGGEGDEQVAVTASSTSLAACLQFERSVSQGTNPSDPVRISSIFEDALSSGSRSPDWNDQYVSCHSILSDGEWTGADAGRHETGPTTVPMGISATTPRHKLLNSHKIQRSASMKSFFSSICCRIDAGKL